MEQAPWAHRYDEPPFRDGFRVVVTVDIDTNAEASELAYCEKPELAGDCVAKQILLGDFRG